MLLPFLSHTKLEEALVKEYRGILRQPGMVPCTVPYNAPSTFCATVYDSQHGRKPSTLECDQIPEKEDTVAVATTSDS